MKKLNLFTVIILGAVTLFASQQATAQDDHKVDKAKANLCTSINAFILSLENLDMASESGSYDDLNKAYNKADKAYNKMIKKADKLEDVEIKESVKAYNNLVDTINDIQSDTSDQFSNEQISEHIDATAAHINDIITGICQ